MQDPVYADRPSGIFLTEAARRNPLLQQGMQHPMLREFREYWDRKRAGRPTPKRTDIDPTEIGGLLPHILIVENLKERNFRYRLVGTAVTAASGAEITGTCVGENTTGRYREFLLTLYETAFKVSRPVFSRNVFPGVEELRKAAIRLLLPLSDDKKHSEQVIAVYVFDYDKILRGPITIDDVKRAQISGDVIEVL